MMENIKYEFIGAYGHNQKAFELDEKYEYIKGRIILEHGISLIKILPSISKVIGKTVKETRDWLKEKDAKGYNDDWFDIKSVEDVRALHYALGSQIQFEAISINDAKDKKISDDWEAKAKAERIAADVWHKSLSDEHKRYVEVLQNNMIAR